MKESRIQRRKFSESFVPFLSGIIYGLACFSRGSAWQGASGTPEQVWVITPGTVQKALILGCLLGILPLFIRRKHRTNPGVFLGLLLPLGILAPSLEPLFRLPVFLVRRFPYIAPALVTAAYLSLSGVSFPFAAIKRLTRAHRNVALFLIVLIAGTWAGHAVFSHLALTGDEPQYFKIAQSIIADGDIDLRNQEPGYSPFWPGDWCRLHHLNRLKTGKLVSIHSPGLPLLLAVPIKTAGRFGACVLFSLFLAAISVLGYRTSSRVATDEAAWWAALAVSIGAPMVFFAFQFYPELPAALSIAVIVFQLSRPWMTKSLLPTGVAIAFLPWLHVKYTLLAFVAAGLVAIQFRRDKAALFRVLILPALSAVAWMAFNHSNYHSIFPFAAYSEYAQSTGIIETNLLFGMGFYLADARHSLLYYAPLFLMSVFGFGKIIRTAPFFGISLLLLAGAQLPAILGHVSLRWLGWAPPCRFWIPVLVLSIPALAVTAARWKNNPFLRWLMAWSAAWQIFLAIHAIRFPTYIHQRDQIVSSRLAGAVHPGSFWGLIPDDADPLRVLLYGCAWASFLVFPAALCAHLARSSKAFQRRAIHVFAGFLLFIWISLGALHRAGESTQRSKLSIAPIEKLNFLRDLAYPSGGSGIVLTIPMESSPSPAPPSLTWLTRRQPSHMADRMRVSGTPAQHIQTARQHARKGWILSALTEIERAEQCGADPRQILEMKLDIFRARRDWETVMELARQLDHATASRYSHEELQRIVCAANVSLARAYDSLTRIPNLTPSERHDFIRKAQTYTGNCPGTPPPPVPFKALPELKEMGIWPE